MRKKILGVMGSSRGLIQKKNILLAKKLGKIIAEKKLILLTGACDGIPYEVLKEAKKNICETLGISAGRSYKEHMELYKSDLSLFDKVIYTGFGDLGRTIINIRSSDMLIFIQGGAGTLTELAQAIGEKKRIGILKNTGGICDISEKIIEKIDIDKKCKIFFEEDPEILLNKLLEE